jgi:hypothetical protein
MFDYEALKEFYLFRHSHSNMLLSKDKSGLACNKVENRAQAAPIDSYSHCSKSRITLGREPIQDMGKKQDRTCP